MGGETSDGGNFALPYAGLGQVAIARGAAYKAAASQSRDHLGAIRPDDRARETDALRPKGGGGGAGDQRQVQIAPLIRC
jgi:hypothetical protein